MIGICIKGQGNNKVDRLTLAILPLLESGLTSSNTTVPSGSLVILVATSLFYKTKKNHYVPPSGKKTLKNQRVNLTQHIFHRVSH